MCAWKKGAGSMEILLLFLILGLGGFVLWAIWPNFKKRARVRRGGTRSKAGHLTDDGLVRVGKVYMTVSQARKKNISITGYASKPKTHRRTKVSLFWCPMNDPFWNIVKASNLRSQGLEHRLTVTRLLALDDCTDKIVNKHLHRRIEQESAQADFCGYIADHFSALAERGEQP
jgi:hypothetical protein